MRPLRNSSVFVAAVLLGIAVSNRPALAFAIYTVGAGCPYATIQDAVNAAYANPGEDYVWIANNQSYSGQHVIVFDQDVDIEGGFTDCNDYTIGPNDYTTISGAGNDGGPVFEITGNSHVYLGNLVITGSQRADGDRGGGISFTGQGGLTLGNTTVSQNHAGIGGGIYVSAQSTNVTLTEARLTLLANTLILSNTAAQNGGGLAIASALPSAGEEFATELYATSDSTFIAYNHANELGGGIFIGDDAVAYVGSPGYGSLGVIFDNTANQGGGAAVYVDRSPKLSYPSTLDLFAVDAARPARIQNNQATQSGGGIYVGQAAVGTLAQHPRSCLTARDFRIDENVAPEGTAIYTETNPGPVSSYAYGMDLVAFNKEICGEPNPGVAYTSCASGVVCNSIDNNVAEDGLGNPTNGATIFFQTDGELAADRVSLRHNSGYNLVHTIDLGVVDAKVALTNMLLADNTMSSVLLNFEGYAQPLDVGVYNATITHNASPSAYVVYTENSLALQDSIIDQPGQLTVAYAGPTYGFYGGGDVSNDTSTLGTGSVQGTATFVDAAAGDYHLLPTSLGVDFASSSVNYSADLDGNPRVRDLTSVPNVPGDTLDAGAYEVQFVCAVDEVFCNGFE